MKSSEFIKDDKKWVEAVDAKVWKNAKAPKTVKTKPTKDQIAIDSIKNIKQTP